MRCERCRGLGRLTYDELQPTEKADVGFGAVFPCPDCGGCGIAHCCDGLIADTCEAPDDA